MKDKLQLESELEKIEKRLAELRIQWKQGSPAMRKWIERGGLLLRDRQKAIQKRLEAQKQQLAHEG